MKKLFILLTSLLSAGSMMAEPVTLTFKDYPKADSDLGTAFTTTTLLDSLQNSAGFVTCTNVENTYAARIGMGSKLGTSSKTGTFTLSLVNPAEFDSIVVNAASYSKAEGSLSINGGEAIDLTDGGTSNKALRNIAYIPTGSVETFTLATTAKRAYVKSITFYPKSSSPVTTTYNVNLTINDAVEGDVVLAGADTAQAVIEPAIIFQEGDNKVPAGNYIFVTAFSDIDYTREAVITVNGDTVDTYFGMWTSETTIDADMNIVVSFPEPAPTTTDTIKIHITNPKWTDAVADEGWWQISGYNADSSYYASLSNVETTEVAGTYSIADMDLDFTFIYKIGATNVKIAIADITVKAELVEGLYVFTSTIDGQDGNTYSLTFDPIDDNAIRGDDYDSPEDMEYTFAAADSVAWTMQTYQGVPYAILRAEDAKASIAIYLNFMGDTIPAGIYPFGDTYAAGTAVAGGVYDGRVVPSYFGYLTANGKISVPLFYCTSGSAEVSYVDDMIKVEVNAINTWQKSGHFTFYVNAHKPAKVVPTNVKLTDADFHAWTSALPGAEIDDTKKYFESHFGEEKTNGATLYGCGNVLGTQYADLTGYDSITFFGKGTFRVLYNATADVDPKGHVEKLFTTNEDGYVTFAINNLEYFHLNVIKAPFGEAVQRLDSIILNYKPTTTGGGDGDTIAIHLVEPQLADYTSQMGMWLISGYSEDERYVVGVCGVSESAIAGDYTMDNIEASYYTYVYDNDTDTEYAPADFNGKVELKEGAYVLSAIFTAEDGTVFVLTSDPIDPNAGNQYDMQEDIEKNFTEIATIEYKSEDGEFYAFVDVENDKEMFSMFFCLDADTLKAGTYEINSTFEAPSVLAGEIDMSEGDLYPTFYGTIEEGYINDLFLCTGGTVTVSIKNDSILFDVLATNTWGKTGHFTFCSVSEPSNKPQLEVVNTIANVIACADAKVLNDNDSVKVTGYISGMFLKPSNFMTYGSVCIWLTDTLGGSAKEFELYNCYGMMGDTLATWGPNFVETGTKNIDVESVTGRHGIEFKLGDKIVATGKFKFYNGTYELSTGCYIVEGGAPTGITTLAAEKATKDGKFLEKNDIVIVKNGKRYNVLGTPIK